MLKNGQKNSNKSKYATKCKIKVSALKYLFHEYCIEIRALLMIMSGENVHLSHQARVQGELGIFKPSYAKSFFTYIIELLICNSFLL